MRPIATLSMSLEASQITASESELFQAILSDTADEVVAVNLDGEQLTVLVETIGGLSNHPRFAASSRTRLRGGFRTTSWWQVPSPMKWLLETFRSEQPRYASKTRCW